MRPKMITRLNPLMSLILIPPAWAASVVVPIGVTPLVTQAPGPSAALFAEPPYQCVANVYVATTGSDSAAGTSAAPWLTIQHADTTATAGTCVNVLPGIYPAGSMLTHGGNAATPTGYVVYRCATLLGCVITDQAKGFSITAAGAGPNYVMIDGFELAAASKAVYGVGINAWSQGDTMFAAHHIWALNNKIHGYGQSGIQLNDGDWFFALHNETYGNSNVTCDAQGSGISLVTLKALAGYTPTAMDLQWSPYHVVVNWNHSHDNALTQCGTASNQYDTDGNGIIMDTLDNHGSTNVLFPSKSLVAFNVAHGNGGRGVWVFRSSLVTMSNNTSYNNSLDPFSSATFRPEIGVGGGHQNIVINNIAWSVPGSTSPTNMNAAFGGGDAAGEVNANNVWQNNVSYGGTPRYNSQNGNTMYNADATTFTCAANKCNVSPMLAGASVGNFAPTATSPAIGYGQRQPYLPATSVDVGACSHSLSTCP